MNLMISHMEQIINKMLWMVTIVKMMESNCVYHNYNSRLQLLIIIEMIHLKHGAQILNQEKVIQMSLVVMTRKVRKKMMKRNSQYSLRRMRYTQPGHSSRQMLSTTSDISRLTSCWRMLEDTPVTTIRSGFKISCQKRV